MRPNAAKTASAQLKAQYAILIEHFHLTPEQIGKLTRRQIQELYFHKRDKAGQIIVGGTDPEGRFDSVEEELAEFDKFNASLGNSIANPEIAKRKIREKWETR